LTLHYNITLSIVRCGLLRGYMQGDKLMRQPNYLPDRDQLLDDLDGGGDGVGGLLDDVAPGAVRITVDEYLNPQDVASPTDTELLASVCNVFIMPPPQGAS